MSEENKKIIGEIIKMLNNCPFELLVAIYTCLKLEDRDGS